jgi:hypothetical protein
MSDDGSVTIAEEQTLLDEQRRLAEEDLARRARERLEMMRQVEIQATRKAAGLCVFCGGCLSRVARLFGSRHRRCNTFSA